VLPSVRLAECPDPRCFDIEFREGTTRGENNVRKSGPPKVRLRTTSGVRRMPITSPDGAITQMPPEPTQNTRPLVSTLMPSGTPGAAEDISQNTRLLLSVPSGATSNARMRRWVPKKKTSDPLFSLFSARLFSDSPRLRPLFRARGMSHWTRTFLRASRNPFCASSAFVDCTQSLSVCFTGLTQEPKKLNC
jgi:hypothetical protein